MVVVEEGEHCENSAVVVLSGVEAELGEDSADVGLEGSLGQPESAGDAETVPPPSAATHTAPYPEPTPQGASAVGIRATSAGLEDANARGSRAAISRRIDGYYNTGSPAVPPGIDFPGRNGQGACGRRPYGRGLRWAESGWGRRC